MSVEGRILAPLSAVLQALGRCLGVVPMATTPDAIASAVGGVQWSKIDRWESYSDADLATMTGLLRVPFVGQVLVVTDSSLARHRGALMMEASELEAFVTAHLSARDECFFDGDVIVAEVGGPWLWIFHHEGLFTSLERRLP